MKEKFLADTFEGLDGKFQFDSKGIVERKTSVYQFTGEEWEVQK